MRLWSVHPKYLDAQGLVALWREALLAQAVLRGRTRGYRHHPQLQRFRSHAHPKSAINSFLLQVGSEATARGYSFDLSKIGPVRKIDKIPVSTGQIHFEWQHLLKKLRRRNPQLYRRWKQERAPKCHPLFRKKHGPIAAWEK